MTRATPHLLFATLIALLACGCEREHPAYPDLRAFLDAVEFGDRERLWELHVDSTTSSDWCSAQFRAIIEKAQQSRAEEECERVRALGKGDLDQMNDELRLAVQVAAFACEAPRGTCVDYGRRVFDQALAQNQLIVQHPQSHNVRRLFGDEDGAVAYVDFSFADGTNAQKVFEIRRIGNKWRITSGFLQ